MKIGDKIRCIRPDVGLTVGEDYKVAAWVNGFDRTCIKVDGKDAPYYADYFEVITTSLEDKIKLAKSYIGKRVISYVGTTYTPTKVDIISSVDDASRLKIASSDVLDQFKNSEIVVVVSDERLSYSIEGLKLAPIYKTVKLNDKYEAVVYVDKIVVGCQTFPINILDNLEDAHYSIS